ncbi:MAG: class I SAM-dependent methyltransferase [Patescibacteria group bacterium]|jgi:2-polyprenyl-3-methyl-5-hydroxy-6-metoxy-1,4-benzoquinol methylase
MATKKFLDQSAGDYHSAIVKGWENLYEKKREYLYQKLRPFHKGDLALELGPADGIMTQKLAKDFKKIIMVDGSQDFLDQAKKKIKSKHIESVCALFEDFETNLKFDTIFMTHILEHLDDPIKVLKNAREWLRPGGHVLISVPNANSIHRLIGVKMGLLAEKDSLNEQDKLLGHKRIYTPELLRQHVRSAGLKEIYFGGIMLKPISNRQIEEQWSKEMIDAFFAAGEDMPELCSEINLIATK